MKPTRLAEADGEAKEAMERDAAFNKYCTKSSASKQARDEE